MRTDPHQQRDQLGRFPKGKSGNPGGKPVGVQSAANRALEALAKAATPQAMRQIAKKIVERAKVGDIDFIVLLYDRLCGKPKQAVDVVGDVAIHTVRIHFPGLPDPN